MNGLLNHQWHNKDVTHAQRNSTAKSTSSVDAIATDPYHQPRYTTQRQNNGLLSLPLIHQEPTPVLLCMMGRFGLSGELTVHEVPYWIQWNVIIRGFTNGLAVPRCRRKGEILCVVRPRLLTGLLPPLWTSNIKKTIIISIVTWTPNDKRLVLCVCLLI